MAKTTEAKRGKFAFQCKNCGAVESKEAAGDNEVPGACRNCRSGVKFDTSGGGLSIVQEPENWIILADLSDAELKKGFSIHGLTPDDIEGHKANPPKATGKTATHHKRAVSERIGSKDRG